MARYTSDEMREIADELALVNDEYHRKASAMLFQSADAMEREDERKKKYEYGLKDEGGFVSCYHSPTLHVAHVLKTKVETVVRRSVGEWEEVSNDNN